MGLRKYGILLGNESFNLITFNSNVDININNYIGDLKEKNFFKEIEQRLHSDEKVQNIKVLKNIVLDTLSLVVVIAEQAIDRIFSKNIFADIDELYINIKGHDKLYNGTKLSLGFVLIGKIQKENEQYILDLFHQYLSKENPENAEIMHQIVQLKDGEYKERGLSYYIDYFPYKIPISKSFILLNKIKEIENYKDVLNILSINNKNNLKRYLFIDRFFTDDIHYDHAKYFEADLTEEEEKEVAEYYFNYLMRDDFDEYLEKKNFDIFNEIGIVSSLSSDEADAYYNAFVHKQEEVAAKIKENFDVYYNRTNANNFDKENDCKRSILAKLHDEELVIAVSDYENFSDNGNKGFGIFREDESVVYKDNDAMSDWYQNIYQLINLEKIRNIEDLKKYCE